MKKTSYDHGREYLPRVAASSYLNTAPLIWSFIKGTMRREVALVTDTSPARCSAMLECGEVDAALVPIIDYQTIPGVNLLGDVCVGSRSDVRSVVLVTRGCDLEEVRKVALDEESRTSAALVRVVFREFLNAEPVWTTSAPKLDMMLAEADAALLIGDPAMTFNRSELRVFDLASLWRANTGLGFVFAMWMGSPNSLRKTLAIDFSSARDEGLRHVNEIAEAFESKLGLPRTELCKYLRENITFTFEPDMRKGLELFYKLAYKHNLISKMRQLGI